jgi:histidinol dehydrogenase
MAAQDLIDTVNQGLDNVLPGRKIASVLANGEGLQAHAMAAQMRLK